jgi:hypothetical protein
VAGGGCQGRTGEACVRWVVGWVAGRQHGGVDLLGGTHLVVELPALMQWPAACEAILYHCKVVARVTHQVWGRITSQDAGASCLTHGPTCAACVPLRLLVPPRGLVLPPWHPCGHPQVREAEGAPGADASRQGNGKLQGLTDAVHAGQPSERGQWAGCCCPPVHVYTYLTYKTPTDRSFCEGSITRAPACPQKLREPRLGDDVPRPTTVLASSVEDVITLKVREQVRWGGVE